MDAEKFPHETDADQVVDDHGAHRGDRRTVHAQRRDQRGVRRDGHAHQQHREGEVVAVALARDEDHSREARVHFEDASQSQEKEYVASGRVRGGHQREDVVQVDPDREEKEAAYDQVHQRHVAVDALHAGHIALFPQVRYHRRGYLHHRAVGDQHRADHVHHDRVDTALHQPFHTCQHRLVDHVGQEHRRAAEVLPQAVDACDRDELFGARGNYRMQVGFAQVERVEQQDQHRDEVDRDVTDDELFEVEHPQRIERNFGGNQQPQQHFVDRRRNDRARERLQPRAVKVIEKGRQPERDQQQVIFRQQGGLLGEVVHHRFAEDQEERREEHETDADPQCRPEEEAVVTFVRRAEKREELDDRRVDAEGRELRVHHRQRNEDAGQADLLLAQEVREQQNLVDIAHHNSHIGEDGDRDAVPFDDAHGASVSVLVFGLRGGPIRGLSAAARAAAESIRVSPLCGRAAGSPLPVVCYILSGTPMPSRRIDAESVRATVAASVRRSACLAGSLSRITGKSW